MEDKYKRLDVLQELYAKALTVCDKVFVSSRPTSADRMEKFIVVRLSQGITPYADTHSTAYVQMNCYAKDRQGGLENVNVMQELIDGVISLVPFNDSLMSCNDTPLILETKSDGIGFHATAIQFKIVIKV